MYLSRHQTSEGPRWALDQRYLPKAFDLGLLLELPRQSLSAFLRALPTGEAASGPLLAPIEADQEVWAAGVTYLRSRDAREAESQLKDVYTRVYEAERPELFMKAVGVRVVGHHAPIRVRKDSQWNVPEPELALVVNAHAEIVGYAAGNDVSSRDIEGENPLYLPQAKIYDGSCAFGPGIHLCEPESLRTLAVKLVIRRAGHAVFEAETNITRMKRKLEELVDYLTRELSFPRGVVLFTGTGIVPPAEFSMTHGDSVAIQVGELALENVVG